MQVKQQNGGYYIGMYLHNKSIFQQISKNFIDKIQNIKITEYSSLPLIHGGYTLRPAVDA